LHSVQAKDSTSRFEREAQTGCLCCLVVLHPVVAKVWHFVEQEQMLRPNDKIVLGVSGGADSTAMLHIFHELTKKLWPAGAICVAHLNHNLRGNESDGDEQFVRSLCVKLKVACFVESAAVREIADNSKENLEATARKLRYEFFLRVANECAATRVATAHTINDQAETFLLRLIRGSGGAGLAGIAPIRMLQSTKESDQSSVSLIRPLLCLTRDEVISYCGDNHLDYRTDSSNLVMDYSRNKVRHEIIPQLALLNPQVVSVLSESADRLRTDESFLQREAIERLNSVNDQDPQLLKTSLSIPVSLLIEADAALRIRIIREIVRRIRGDLSRITNRHLSSIESLLKAGKSGKAVAVPGARIAREFGVIVFRRSPIKAGSIETLKPAVDYLHTLREDSEVRISLNNRELIIGLIRTEKYVWGDRSRFTALLDGSLVDLPLMIRPRRRGDRYLKVGAENSTSVKELMIENRVPLNERIIYPVITTSDDEIVWVPGLPVAAKFAAGPKTTDWVVINAIFADITRSE